jgi:hypothetical protein
MAEVKNGIIIDNVIYESIEVDDITAKCCKGCAFEHSDGDCPSMVCKYIQWKNDVGVIFRKVEKDGKTE